MDNKKTTGSEVTPPEVTAKITWVNDDPAANKRASANITIAKCFTIHGLSVMNSSKGLFVAMPTKVKQDHGTNKYYEIAHPVTASMRQLISERVISAYQEMVETQEHSVNRMILLKLRRRKRLQRKRQRSLTNRLVKMKQTRSVSCRRWLRIEEPPNIIKGIDKCS